MTKKLYFAMFLVGVLTDTAATWHCVKKKYEKIAQEEIDSVKAVFRKKEAERAEEKNPEEIPRETKGQAEAEPGREQFREILRTAGYALGIDEEENGKAAGGYCPYVITPEEFGEFEEYEQISLTYYADGVLADEDDEVVDDVEDIVGDALEHFGEYEDDSVFVRCDERKCDYEVLLDRRSYMADIAPNKPKRVEVR